MKTFITLTIALLALLSGPKAVATTLREIVRTCSPEIEMVSNSQLEKSPLLIAQAEKVAFDLSQIWGDTILEGDFYANNEVRVEKLETVVLDNELVGYRVTYSAKAWNTESCNFHLEDKSTLENCPVGRIVESGFFSSTSDEMFVDRTAYAKFIRD